jgi:hypothetical protein
MTTGKKAQGSEIGKAPGMREEEKRSGVRSIVRPRLDREHSICIIKT